MKRSWTLKSGNESEEENQNIKRMKVEETAQEVDSEAGPVADANIRCSCNTSPLKSCGSCSGPPRRKIKKALYGKYRAPKNILDSGDSKMASGSLQKLKDSNLPVALTPFQKDPSQQSRAVVASALQPPMLAVGTQEEQTSSAPEVRCVQRTSSVTVSSTEVLEIPRRLVDDKDPYSDLAVVPTAPTGPTVLEEFGSTLDEKNDLDKSRNLEPTAHEQQSDVSSNAKVVDVDWTEKSFTVTTLIGHYDIIKSVVFDGNVIITGSRDTTVRVWRPEGKQLFSLCGHAGEVTSVTLLDPATSLNLSTKLCLPPCQMVVSGALDCNLKLWDITNGREIKTMYTFNGISCTCWWGDAGRVVVGTEGGKVELWDLVDECCSHSVKAHDELVVSVQVHANILVSASENFNFRIWTQEEGKLKCSKEITEAGKCEIGGITCSNEIARAGGSCGSFLHTMVLPSVEKLYFGDESPHIKEINLSDGQKKKYQNVPQNLGITNALCVCDDFLFASSYDMESKDCYINGRRMQDNTGLRYLFSLKDDEDSRILCIDAKCVDNKLTLVTGGTSLKVWSQGSGERRRSRTRVVTTSFFPYLSCTLDSHTSESTSAGSTDSDSTSNCSSSSRDSRCRLM